VTCTLFLVVVATTVPKTPFALHKSPQTPAADAASAVFVHDMEAQIDAWAETVPEYGAPHMQVAAPAGGQLVMPDTEAKMRHTWTQARALL
jgi:hypothetical protein